MEDDDLSRGPHPKQYNAAVGADLSAMSLDELRERIATLQAEIDRSHAEIAKKQAQVAAASAFFK